MKEQYQCKDNEHCECDGEGVCRNKQDWKDKFDKKFSRGSSGKSIMSNIEEYRSVKDFIESLLAEQRNTVLSEVDKEVGKELRRVATSKISFADKIVYQKTQKDISTIINNLRVK